MIEVPDGFCSGRLNKNRHPHRLMVTIRNIADDGTRRIRDQIAFSWILEVLRRGLSGEE